MNARYLDFVWAVLMVSTLLTWWIGKTTQLAPGLVIAVLVIAGIKGWLIIEDFMGLRRVRFLWRGLVLGWLWATLFVILFAYWLGMR